MKRLNAYYLISIISLAFMFLILMRTLQAIGWFEDDEKKRFAMEFMQLAGDYEMISVGDIESKIPVDIEARSDEGENWLDLRIQGQLSYGLRVSDFEDDQVLVEIFRADTSGSMNRIEGCECPIRQDEAGSWEGSTLGEFCSYDVVNDRYLSIRFVGDKAGSSVIIESRAFEEKTLFQKQEYFLKRRTPDE